MIVPVCEENIHALDVIEGLSESVYMVVIAHWSAIVDKARFINLAQDLALNVPKTAILGTS